MTAVPSSASAALALCLLWTGTGCSDEQDARVPDGRTSGGAGGTSGGAGAAAPMGGAGGHAAAGQHADGGLDASAPEAGTAGSGGGSPGTVRGPLPTCTDPVGSCPARSIGVWKLLLDAADFGPEARLIAMGHQTVLVAVGDGSFRVVRLRDPSDEASSSPPYVASEFASGDMRPLAVADGKLSVRAPAPPDTLAVLACDDARTHCSLFRSEVGPSELTAWQEIELPAEFVASGVVIDPAVEPRILCVYGNGMVCLQEGWQAPIAPGSDLQLHDVTVGAEWSLAIGDQGRWFARVRDGSGALGTWQEQAPLGEGVLTMASVEGSGAVITGEARIVAAVGAQAEQFACGPPGELVAFMLWPGQRGLAYALTRTGQVLQHALLTAQRTEPYCAYQQLSLEGMLLGADTAPCGSSMNPRVLTDRALFGTNLCLSIQG